MKSYYIEWAPFLAVLTMGMLAMATLCAHVDLIEPSLWTANAELIWEKHQEPKEKECEPENQLMDDYIREQQRESEERINESYCIRDKLNG